MNTPSWNIFRSQSDQENVFERDVARRLFCHEAKIAPKLLTCPPNYPGIENVPVESPEGWVAFQAKHSQDGSQNGNAFDSLRKVISPIRAGDYKLDKIYCFSSGVAPATKTGLTAEQQRIVSDLKSEGVTLEWYYSDRIITILEDATTPSLLRASQKFFEHLPQPHLGRQEKTNNPKGFRCLRFNERRSEFKGRASELKQLDRFTNTDEFFSWWLVTGPGFSGKSRLLLEHCRKLDNWHWGWLEADLDNFSFSNWIPKKNTFVVVDYVLGREIKLQKLFQQVEAASRSDRFVHKVRLIFLEREYAGWLRAVEHTASIGNWIAERKYKCDDLTIERIPKVLAAIEDFPSGEFLEVIRELVNREKIRRWEEAPKEALEALILATACGGFSLEKLPSSVREETQLHLDQLNHSETVAKMIGVEHKTNLYPPLEPDVFGELLVLDTIEGANPSYRQTILQRAYELNAPRLVNFLYRCSQSFPEHPALKSTLNDWSYDEASRLAYLATFANGLDSSSFSESLRLRTYHGILTNLVAPSVQFFHIERAIFGKILALFPDNNLEIEPAEIQLRPAVEINAQPTNMGTLSNDVLSSLLPEVYSLAVLNAWRQLNDQNQITLLGPHLVEVFHHQIIRSLITRPLSLKIAKDLFSELTRKLEISNGHRYVATIYSFHQLCANVIAVLVQFNHRSEESMDWADEIRVQSRALSTLNKGNEKAFLETSFLYRIELGLTVMVAHFRHRPFDYKLQRLNCIMSLDSGIQPFDEYRILIYVQAAVAASTGFNGNDEAKEARRIFERCREYTKIVETPEIVNSFSMILGNLAGYATSYDLGQSTWDFLEEAVQLACRYPEPQYGIIKLTLNKLSTHYKNQIHKGELKEAQKSMMLVRRMIESANAATYQGTERLHAGAFVDPPLRLFVDGQLTKLEEAKEMVLFLSNSSALNWEQMMNNSSAFSDYYSMAQNVINEDDRSRAIRALSVLEFYSSIDQTRDYSPVMRIVRDNLAV